MMHSLKALLLSVVMLTGTVALAQQGGAADQDLIERVVVRNRLYNVAGRIEVGPSVGLTLMTRLTDHYNFNLGAAYNLSETLAFELRGGWAYSRQTGLARQIGEEVLDRDPAVQSSVSDLSGLWEMKANGLAGVRWAPLYGKISLLAELPVHFQAYLWAGGGAGMFERESVVYCQAGANQTERTCDQWRQADKIAWIGSGALGFRFFTHQGGGLRLEVRNYLFPDSYLVNINRAEAQQGRETGEEAPNPGLTNLVLFDIGYTFIF